LNLRTLVLSRDADCYPPIAPWHNYCIQTLTHLADQNHRLLTVMGRSSQSHY
jgi:hypothetical protein